jgi:hypothetical protein
MATKKITQNELEEMIREMVTKMVNEMPGEAPMMEKEEKVKFTSRYDDSPKLKGKQNKLPDHLQKAIIGADDEGVDEANMSSNWQRSASGRSYKKRHGKKMGTHYLDEEKLAELEEKKRAIIKQLEELNFGNPHIADPDTETETGEETITTTPPRPGRPNPFRREEDDTEVIPDLEPQGSLKDVIKRYLQTKK